MLLLRGGVSGDFRFAFERALPSKDMFVGRWKTVCAGATAYSAYAPPGVSIGWKAATRSPMWNSPVASAFLPNA